ncbi:MAG: YaiO family outer membrane beta-barrel protein, partial [Bacteroidota bacterium]
MKKKLVLCFVFVLMSTASWAQSQMSDLSVDQLYEEARHLAFEDGDYDTAREYAYEALDRSPDYHDIRIFVARLHSWEEDYHSARQELQSVLKKDPENKQALIALIDTEQWSGNSDAALHTANKALEYHSGDVDIQLKKAGLLYSLERYDDSEEVYKTILDNSPSSKKARDGLEDAQLAQMKYQATVSYRYDRFRTIFDPWHFTEFGLTRQTPIGSVAGRVEYAQRFGSDGVQFNVDAYPSITDGLYAYVSGGYSDSPVHPKYRFGFSLYKTLPSAFELEGGIRYLDFGSSQTDIYTVSLTKYKGSYLITGRAYIVPSSDAVSRSINIVTRRYFGTAD